MPRYLVVIEADDLKFVTTLSGEDGGSALADALDALGEQNFDGVQHVKMEVSPVEERKDA